MVEPWPAHLLLIGCGNMAGQMLARWLECGLDPARVTVVRPSGTPVAPGVTVRTDYPEMLAPGTLVLLGMKPQQLDGVAAGLAPICGPDIAIVSILAGVTVERLRSLFPDAADVVRVMPNLPVGIGEGVSALYADGATGQDARETVAALAAWLGVVEWIDAEDQFNLVTALSGCGPAFLFRFIDALAAAGEALGLDPHQAQRMALATVQGSSTLAARSPDSVGVLADRVASPGGMTREGMNVLDADARLVALMTETLTAARDRGEVLARG